MTITWKAVAETQDGEHASEIPDGAQVTELNLDAIGRMYDEAKARIADPADTTEATDLTARWHKTEAIDVRAIKPPVASRGSTRDPASPSGSREREAPAGHCAAQPPAVPRRAWRAWRGWFSGRAGATV